VWRVSAVLKHGKVKKRLKEVYRKNVEREPSKLRRYILREKLQPAAATPQPGRSDIDEGLRSYGSC